MLGVGHPDLFHELTQDGGFKLGHFRVLLHHGNDLPDVGFLLLLLFHFPPQGFHDGLKLLLLLFIVTGQLDKSIIRQLAGNVVLR